MEYSNVWIEKYRPQKISELVLDSDIEDRINAFLQNRNNVHLMISGMPGVGKTTTVRCVAKKILGENIKDGYLELNAAEDRGVGSISAIIPPFCRRVVNFNKSRVILFDEADNLTQKCQHIIANMIKEFGYNTKFIFTCNVSDKIIEDIQSVCRIIRYKPLTNEQIKKYLINICAKEGIKYNDSGLNIICTISGGDMRKAINDLQKTAYTYNKIDKKSVISICSIPDPADIEKVIKYCLEKNIDSAIESTTMLIEEGFHYPVIITSFVNVLITFPDISEHMRLQLIHIVNQTKIIISTSSRSRLQLTGMICRLIMEIEKH